MHFQWVTASQPVFQVCLVLISFVVAWTEAWFLDFRVIPQELHAQQYLQSKLFLEFQSWGKIFDTHFISPDSLRQSDSLTALFNDPQMRNPLLRNFLQRLPRMEDSTESVGSYYSPLESADHSDDETVDHRKEGLSVFTKKKSFLN